MAARPNTVRTLEYGLRIAEHQVKRLNETIEMATRVVTENHLLTKEDIASYKECISVAKRQLACFEKAAALEVPRVKLASRRKRGRPSKAELEALGASRKGRASAVAAAPVAKKRGRPAKVKAAVVAVAAPKRRGRPPKAKPEVAAVATATKGKPGRKPKTISGVDVSALTSDQQAAIKAVLASASPAPKRRGRPPKNRDANTNGIANSVTNDTQPNTVTVGQA